MADLYCLTSPNVEKVAAIKSNRDNATDNQKDRFFNRGKYARAAAG